MTTRREFILGTVSAALLARSYADEVEKRIVAAAHYAGYLDAVAARIKVNAVTCDTGFWFITDQHVRSNHRQSGIVCGDLIGRTGLTRVLCGGDLPEAFGKGYPTDKAAVDFAIDNFRDFWVKPLRAAGGRLYCAKGNHDFTVRHSMDKEDPVVGYTYAGTDAKRFIVDQWTEPGIVTNAEDPTACYYYQDDVTAKIRYIVADTSDTERAGNTAWGVVCGVHDTQLTWLASQAFGTVPAGYDVVVMHHIPVTGIVGDDNGCRAYANLRNLLEAYQNRGKITVGKRDFDFSKATGRILLDLTGHEHAERQTFQNGILYVTEPCDAAYGDYIIGSAPWCTNLPRKQKGTVYEQTFEAIQIAKNRSLLRFTRVGGGQDRAIHLTARTVKVGETLKIEPSVWKGKQSFACYNGDRVTFRPNPNNRWYPLVTYGTDFADISAEGVLTARRPGPVIVLAMDENLNKEIFPITIVG